MAHMVTFTSPEGRKGYHQVEDLDEALAFVERLRNSEGVTDAQVFRMEEVAIEVKQYYKVEVVGPGGQPAAAPAAPVPPAAAPVSEQYGEVASNVAPVPEAATGPEPVAAPEGRPSFSIFTRS